MATIVSNMHERNVFYRRIAGKTCSDNKVDDGGDDDDVDPVQLTRLPT